MLARCSRCQPAVGRFASGLSPAKDPTKLEAEEVKNLNKADFKVDQGYLSFTRNSLFKLTLPLDPPINAGEDPFSDPGSADEEDETPASLLARDKAKRSNADRDRGKEERHAEDDTNWESIERKHSEQKLRKDLIRLGEIASERDAEQADDTLRDLESKAGHTVSGAEPAPAGRHGLLSPGYGDLQEATNTPVHSVVFLLHAGQPLSYISNLIRAEGPSATPGTRQRIEEVQEREETGMSKEEQKQKRDSERIWATLGDPSVSFLTRAADGKRWSPATAIGDFLRSASRVGSFVIRIGERNLQIAVPSFEDRTRYLRGSLYAKTEEIDKLAQLKTECDTLAHNASKNLAYGGVGILATWWVTVSFLTFGTELGWDAIEPLTVSTSSHLLARLELTLILSLWRSTSPAWVRSSAATSGS